MDIVAEVNRALEYTKEKEYKKAEKIYLGILKQDDKNAVILSLLGLLYLNAGVLKKSEKYLKKAYSIKESVATIEGLGLVKGYLGELIEAGKYLEKVIDSTKSYDVYDMYISFLIETRQYSKAYKYSTECVEKFPLKREGYVTLSYCAINIGKLQEAYALAELVVKRYPKYGSGWIQLGLITEILFHDDDKAAECYKKALYCENKDEAYYNLAVNSDKRKDFKKALYYARKLQRNNPNNDTLCFLFGSIYLRQRKFKLGMKYYAKYVLRKPKTEPHNALHKLKNIWDGKAYKKDKLFLFGDQGIGDCIMFSRYLPILEKKFKKIDCMVSDSILELFKRSFKDNKKITFKPKGKIPRHDHSTVLSVLPYYLKMDFDNIPYSDKYMIADNLKIEKYKELINSDRLKVGISWEAGGIGLRDLLHRTLNISMYEPFLNTENVQFYSLQVKPAMDNYKNYKQLIDLAPTFKDFDDTAGALMNLDLVITVDTSVAHLAGALGVKTFMLLPSCTDWRWFEDDKTTDWYKSIRIFRQKDSKTWDDVMNNIALELKKLADNKDC